MPLTLACLTASTCDYRTANEPVWLWRPGGSRAEPLSRALHPIERGALTGCPPEVFVDLSKAQILEVTGNAFSVPVVAHALSSPSHDLALAPNSESDE